VSVFDSLIKLHRWTLEEQRREVARLEEAIEAQRRVLATLDAELDRERGLELETPAAALSWSAYVGATGERRRSLCESLAESERRLDAARRQLAETYGEVRTYELARDRQREIEREERAQQEQQESDELTLQRLARSDATD
jgi:flagellar export protein FliJ